MLNRAVNALFLIVFAFVLSARAATLEDVERRTGLTVGERTETFCVLTNGADRVVLYPGSRRFEVNSRSIWLNAPVISDFKTGLTFGYPDMAKLICPLFSAPVSTNCNLRIQLDAGHGGEDGGCISTQNRMREKDIVLDIALRAGEILEERGFSVIYSRTDDTFVTLAGRSAIASKQKADAFVSIHANFAGSHTARGSETFTLPFANAQSTSAESSVGTAARIGNANDLRNTLLGYFIHRRLPGRLGESDRGLRHARFQVLRDTPCPAVLVEVGFLSNVNDSRNLASDWYRDRLAMAIADGISEYATYIPEKPQEAPKTVSKANPTPIIATNAPAAVATATNIPPVTVSSTNKVECGSVATNMVNAATRTATTNGVRAAVATNEIPAAVSTNATDAAVSTNASAGNAGYSPAVSGNISPTNTLPRPIDVSTVQLFSASTVSATNAVNAVITNAVGKDKTNAVVVP